MQSDSYCNQIFIGHERSGNGHFFSIKVQEKHVDLYDSKFKMVMNCPIDEFKYETAKSLTLTFFAPSNEKTNWLLDSYKLSGSNTD